MSGESGNKRGESSFLCSLGGQEGLQLRLKSDDVLRMLYIELRKRRTAEEGHLNLPLLTSARIRFCNGCSCFCSSCCSCFCTASARKERIDLTTELMSEAGLPFDSEALQDFDLKQGKRKIEFLGQHYAFQFEPFTVLDFIVSKDEEDMVDVALLKLDERVECMLTVSFRKRPKFLTPEESKVITKGMLLMWHMMKGSHHKSDAIDDLGELNQPATRLNRLFQLKWESLSWFSKQLSKRDKSFFLQQIMLWSCNFVFYGIETSPPHTNIGIFQEASTSNNFKKLSFPICANGTSVDLLTRIKKDTSMADFRELLEEEKRKKNFSLELIYFPPKLSLKALKLQANEGCELRAAVKIHILLSSMKEDIALFVKKAYGVPKLDWSVKEPEQLLDKLVYRSKLVGDLMRTKSSQLADKCHHSTWNKLHFRVGYLGLRVQISNLDIALCLEVQGDTQLFAERLAERDHLKYEIERMM